MAERRQRFGNAAVVGFVGRFVRYKGLSVLVDALARLDNVHALMVGDGPLRPHTEEHARAAGVADRMHFLGNVDELGKIRRLAMMDVLALPSVDTTEAFGVAQIEAQLMGVPVVASRLPTGVTDVTIENETGLLVPPGDPAALAAAISRLIVDRDLAARLARAGRAHALKHFTFAVFEQRFGELFNTLLSGKPLDEAAMSCALPIDTVKPASGGKHVSSISNT
jgi:rhamnosyl/mannosyltransferase